MMHQKVAPAQTGDIGDHAQEIARGAQDIITFVTAADAVLELVRSPLAKLGLEGACLARQLGTVEALLNLVERHADEIILATDRIEEAEFRGGR